MPDVIAFGELLIDFVPTVSNVTLIQAPAFKKAPGGAPANVAVGLSRLGISTGFMGKVGDDAFGHFLAGVLMDNGVDISALHYSDQARTALAFVSLSAGGEREFMFYRHPSADMLFTPDEVNAEFIRKAKIFHFGSVGLIDEPTRSATMRAINVATEAGLLITYDPNLRLNLWPDESSAKKGMLSVWSKAKVIKVSEEELAFLSDASTIGDAVKTLWHDDLILLVVTKGDRGCAFFTSSFSGDVAGYSIDPVDTTGAGDGFVAGLIKGLLTNPEYWKHKDDLITICQYANAVGALTTLERGAIPALPNHEQVLKFLDSYK